MDVFTASTQYNDLKGTVAADRSDNLSLIDYLKENGWANEGDQTAGYRVVFTENHSREIKEPGIVVYLYEQDDSGENPKHIRAIDIDMPIAKFFSYFKRFDLVMAKDHLNLDDVLVTGPDY